MHKNRLWIVFLALFTLLVLWYDVDALFKVYRYNKLTQKTAPLNVQLAVEEKSGRYHYRAQYEYSVAGQTYIQNELLMRPLLRNERAAEELLPEYQSDPHIVWFDPYTPSQGTLQKHYPYKECFYAVVMTALLLYFIWLGFKVAHQAIR